MEAMSDASVSDGGSEAPPAEIATPMMPAPSSSPVSAAATPLLRKKPAARKPWPKERCAGLTGSPCRFHSTGNGEPARIHPDRGELHCLFCDSVKCRATTERVLLNLLKNFKDKGDGLYGAALGRLRQHLGVGCIHGFDCTARNSQTCLTFQTSCQTLKPHLSCEQQRLVKLQQQACKNNFLCRNAKHMSQVRLLRQ